MANLNFIQDTVKRVDEQKKKERRYKMAMYFLRNYDKGSEWLIKENLKLLYFYKDFDFLPLVKLDSDILILREI